MLTDLLRDFQDRDPTTGLKTCPRSLREYAALLGITHPTLVNIYAGDRVAGGKVIRGLVRAFPKDRALISAAIAAPDRLEVA